MAADAAAVSAAVLSLCKNRRILAKNFMKKVRWFQCQNYHFALILLEISSGSKSNTQAFSAINLQIQTKKYRCGKKNFQLFLAKLLIKWDYSNQTT